MCWEDWIMREQGLSIEKTSYDILCEMAVSSYYLNKRSRKADLKDRVHCFLIWWTKNKRLMKSYNTTTTIGRLLNVDHSTVIHMLKRRKQTIMYEDNTKCISDFLNS